MIISSEWPAGYGGLDNKPWVPRLSSDQVVTELGQPDAPDGRRKPGIAPDAVPRAIDLQEDETR